MKVYARFLQKPSFFTPLPRTTELCNPVLFSSSEMSILKFNTNKQKIPRRVDIKLQYFFCVRLLQQKYSFSGYRNQLDFSLINLHTFFSSSKCQKNLFTKKHKISKFILE